LLPTLGTHTIAATTDVALETTMFRDGKGHGHVLAGKGIGNLATDNGKIGVSATGNSGARELNVLVWFFFAIQLIDEVGLLGTVLLATAPALVGSPCLVVGNAYGFGILFSCNGMKHGTADEASSLPVSSKFAIVGGVASNSGSLRLESISRKAGTVKVGPTTKWPVTALMSVGSTALMSVGSTAVLSSTTLLVLHATTGTRELAH
jgi:hypothetical protein